MQPAPEPLPLHIRLLHDVASIAMDDLAWAMAELVPDGRAATAFIHGALDLVGRRRRAPQEIVQEAHGSCLSTPYYTGGRVAATSLARFGRLCTR